MVYQHSAFLYILHTIIQRVHIHKKTSRYICLALHSALDFSHLYSCLVVTVRYVYVLSSRGTHLTEMLKKWLPCAQEYD